MPISSINYDGVNFRLNTNNGLFKFNHLPYEIGLIGTRYVGYHNDTPSWFDTAVEHGDSSVLSTIENFSSSIDYSVQDNYSWQWIGYFKPSTTENYTFYLSSDDGSYLWIGNAAISGYTIENATVNNGGAHGNQETSGSINLLANIYYPIRIQFGEIGGGDILTVSFSSESINKTTNGTGFYFH